MHAMHTIPEQKRLVQSPATLQGVPLSHGAQLPPQSVPVSLPSLLPSVQLASTQRFLLQLGVLGLEQSASTLHWTHFPATAGVPGSPQTPGWLIGSVHIPIWGVCWGVVGEVEVHPPWWHASMSRGTSFGSSTLMMPLAVPSHSTTWQLPDVCSPGAGVFLGSGTVVQQCVLALHLLAEQTPVTR
jgi:hypothetical protein